MQKWSNIHKIHFKSTHEGYPIIEPAEPVSPSDFGRSFS